MVTYPAILLSALHWITVGVGCCSVLTILLAVIERWAQQWFPSSKFTFVLSALTDLVSKFGALNLRDQIAPRQWDGFDRRSEDSSPKADAAQAGKG